MERAAAGRTPGLRSMTGFGAARSPDGLLEVEVRAVNQRHLKVVVRAPEALSGLVPRVEELVRERLSRGAAGVTVRRSEALEGAAWRLDAALLERLWGELRSVAQRLGTEPPGLGQVALIPGVVRAEERAEDPEAMEQALAAVLREALDRVEAMRQAEGAGVARALEEAGAEVLRLADAVEARGPEAMREQSERFQARLQQLLGDRSVLDPSSLAREVALLAERVDVSEELQRLRSHVAQLRQALLAPREPVGRKLEFLAQELHREANTMASKSHDSALVETILAIKLRVEQVREQVANVE